MVQGDAGTNGGEDTEPMLASINLAEEEPIPATKSSIGPQPNPKTMAPTLLRELFTIPEKEEVSIKDYVTSRLPARGQEGCVEAGGCLVMPVIKLTEVYVDEEDGI